MAWCSAAVAYDVWIGVFGGLDGAEVVVVGGGPGGQGRGFLPGGGGVVALVSI